MRLPCRFNPLDLLKASEKIRLCPLQTIINYRLINNSKCVIICITQSASVVI